MGCRQENFAAGFFAASGDGHWGDGAAEPAGEGRARGKGSEETAGRGHSVGLVENF
jgi:hypothetical protein